MIKATMRAVLAGSAICFASACAQAQTFDLKVSHYLPPNHTLHKVLMEWTNDLDRRSDGRLKLKIYPAAQLGPVQRQMDLVKNGQADFALALVGATPGRYPMTELTSLPFVWPSEGSTSAVMSKRLTELAPKYFGKEYDGLHILWMAVTPTNGFFTARKEIALTGDVKGLKIRFQGEQNAKLLRELGAIPLQVPPGEVADGMAKGVIDGALFDYEAAESFGLGSVTHHVAEPGFVTATLVLVMNTAKYEALPADLRKLIDETTGTAEAERLGKLWDSAEKHGRDAMLAQKVGINAFDPVELARLKIALDPLVASAIAAQQSAGKPAQALLDDYRK